MYVNVNIGTETERVEIDASMFRHLLDPNLTRAARKIRKIIRKLKRSISEDDALFKKIKEDIGKGYEDITEKEINDYLSQIRTQIQFEERIEHNDLKIEYMQTEQLKIEENDLAKLFAIIESSLTEDEKKAFHEIVFALHKINEEFIHGLKNIEIEEKQTIANVRGLKFSTVWSDEMITRFLRGESQKEKRLLKEELSQFNSIEKFIGVLTDLAKHRNNNEMFDRILSQLQSMIRNELSTLQAEMGYLLKTFNKVALLLHHDENMIKDLEDLIKEIVKEGFDQAKAKELAIQANQNEQATKEKLLQYCAMIQIILHDLKQADASVQRAA